MFPLSIKGFILFLVPRTQSLTHLSFLPPKPTRAALPPTFLFHSHPSPEPSYMTSVSIAMGWSLKSSCPLLQLLPLLMPLR